MSTIENYFDQFFRNCIEPLLSDHSKLEGAIGLLESEMVKMPSDFERSETYHWLARIHNQVAITAMADGDSNTGQEHFKLVEEFYVKALNEYSPRPQTQLALARFYLAPENRPDLALQILGEDPFPALPGQPESTISFFEHQRLALSGACGAMIGKEADAETALIGAFNPQMLEKLPGPADLSALKHAVMCGAKLNVDRIDAVLSGIDSSDSSLVELLNRLRK